MEGSNDLLNEVCKEDEVSEDGSLPPFENKRIVEETRKEIIEKLKRHTDAPDELNGSSQNNLPPFSQNGRQRSQENIDFGLENNTLNSGVKTNNENDSCLSQRHRSASQIDLSSNVNKVPNANMDPMLQQLVDPGIVAAMRLNSINHLSELKRQQELLMTMAQMAQTFQAQQQQQQPTMGMLHSPVTNLAPYIKPDQQQLLASSTSSCSNVSTPNNECSTVSSSNITARNDGRATQNWSFQEQFKQLYEMSDDPKRREFLDDLFSFMQKRGSPVNRIPIMAKQTLDLYELFRLVVSKGGLVEVINKKLWREITKGLNLPSSITSAAFTLRTQYIKYLYPYECEKLKLSQPNELQSAIDNNKREGRRFTFDLSPPPSLLNPNTPGSHHHHHHMHQRLHPPNMPQVSTHLGAASVPGCNPAALFNANSDCSPNIGVNDSHLQLMNDAAAALGLSSAAAAALAAFTGVSSTSNEHMKSQQSDSGLNDAVSQCQSSVFSQSLRNVSQKLNETANKMTNKLGDNDLSTFDSFKQTFESGESAKRRCSTPNFSHLSESPPCKMRSVETEVKGKLSSASFMTEPHHHVKHENETMPQSKSLSTMAKAELSIDQLIRSGVKDMVQTPLNRPASSPPECVNGQAKSIHQRASLELTLHLNGVRYRGILYATTSDLPKHI